MQRPGNYPPGRCGIDEHLLERSTVGDVIRRAIGACLPEKQRVAVLLHKYEEMDYAEIAKSLGVLGKCAEIAAVSELTKPSRVELAPLVGRQGMQLTRGKEGAVMKCEEISKRV